MNILELSEDEAQKLALSLIGIVDYDTEKECEYNIEADGYDTLVDEVVAFLITKFEGE